MHCLDIEELFNVYKLELSDEYLIECLANIHKKALGNYNTKEVLFQKVHEPYTFLLCAVDRNQEPLGAIMGWLLKTENEIIDHKNYLDSFELPVGYIKSLLVTESWRGKRIGHTLLKNMLHCFCSFDCHHVICDAWDEAVTFWEKEGFSIQSRVANYWYHESYSTSNFCIKCGSPCTCDAIIMKKTLHPTTDGKLPDAKKYFSTHAL